MLLKVDGRERDMDTMFNNKFERNFVESLQEARRRKDARVTGGRQLLVLALALLPGGHLRAKAREVLKRVVPKRRTEAEKRNRKQKAWHFARGLRPASLVLEQFELRARELTLQGSRLIDDLVGIADQLGVHFLLVGGRQAVARGIPIQGRAKPRLGLFATRKSRHRFEVVHGFGFRSSGDRIFHRSRGRRGFFSLFCPPSPLQRRLGVAPFVVRESLRNGLVSRNSGLTIAGC